MEFKPKNREWVKSAAIIFLSVLLVLTFFSKTISNRLLTEVATAAVESGTITAKVRGSGIVTANGSHEVKATQTREVGSVLIKVGQEVETGEVLFTLGAGDSDELEAANEALRNLQQSYRVAAASMPQYNYDKQQNTVVRAEEELDNAQTELQLAEAKLNSAAQSGAARAAYERARASEEKIKELDVVYYALVDYLSAKSDRDSAVEVESNWKAESLVTGSSGYLISNDETQLPQADVNEVNQRYIDADSAMNSAKTNLTSLGVTNPDESKKTEVYNKITAEKQNLDLYQQEYSRLVDGYQATYDAAAQRAETAQAAYESASYDLQAAIYNDEQQINSIYVQLEGIAQQIAAQQEKIKKLIGEDGDGIVSNVNGVVQSISVTSGDKLNKGDVMCVIEVPDMGHTVSFSVTNDQAKRLRVGDSTKVSNFYWGNEIIATLTTMVNDPKAPQSNKLLTFDLTGDVKSGDQITVSVGSKSAGYDVVIPNSAIRSDTNGSFVLAIEAKNSPVGNRYIAKRVNIEVVAEDDEHSAVTGALTNGDFVITTGSAPVKSGDQVRLSDSNK